jgi:hypothetical protein
MMSGTSPIYQNAGFGDSKVELLPPDYPSRKTVMSKTTKNISHGFP